MKVLLNDDHDIRAAHEPYRHFIQTDETRQAYEDRMKFLRDQANREETAREKGLEKGREEGWGKGGASRSREIASRLKTSGMDERQIREITGLTSDEVEAL